MKHLSEKVCKLDSNIVGVDRITKTIQRLEKIVHKLHDANNFIFKVIYFYLYMQPLANSVCHSFEVFCPS